MGFPSGENIPHKNRTGQRETRFGHPGTLGIGCTQCETGSPRDFGLCIRLCRIGVMAHDTYESPLASRNASKEMLRFFSPQHKFGLWRRLWIELARGERELGLSRISAKAVEQMAAAVDDIDFEFAADAEQRRRHHGMAHG